MSNENTQSSVKNIYLLKEGTKTIGPNLIQLKAIVRLESTDSSVFGECSLLKVTPEAYYILDESITRKIYKFDKDGSFLMQIGRIGRGPGEYIEPEWFCVEENLGQVIVYDAGLKRMMFFSDKTGEYLKDIKVNFYARSFETLPDLSGYIFYTSFLPNSNLSTNSEDFQLIITDNEGQVTRTVFPFSSSYNVQNFLGLKSVFSNSNGEVYFFIQYTDTIFKFNQEGQMIPSYVLDYDNDNQKLSDQYVKKMGPNQNEDFSYISSERHSSNVFHLYRQFHTENHLYLTGVRNKETFAFLFDKKSYNVIDLTNYQGIPLNKKVFLAADERYLYTYSNTNYLHNSSDELKKMNIDGLEDLLKEENKDSPIILLYRINRF